MRTEQKLQLLVDRVELLERAIADRLECDELLFEPCSFPAFQRKVEQALATATKERTEHQADADRRLERLELWMLRIRGERVLDD